MTKRRKRRVWSDEEKRMICRQTRVPGVSVSQVARRYDVNVNLVFAWLRDPRFADADAADVERFLPVEIVAEVKAPVHALFPLVRGAYWARKLSKFGHEVRLMQPNYVKGNVIRGKTSALVSALPGIAVFKSGWDLSACLRLIPKPHSTGSKERLGRISKMGSAYLRRFLYLGSGPINRLAVALAA